MKTSRLLSLAVAGTAAMLWLAAPALAGSNRNDAIVKLSQPQIASMLASSAIGPL